MSAELLIPQYSDFPDPEAIVRETAGEEPGNADFASAPETPPVRWDEESLSFAGGFPDATDGKAGRDLGGIGLLEPGEAMWALCFAATTRVAGDDQGSLDAIAGDGDATKAPTAEFWQGGLNFSMDALPGIVSTGTPDPAMPLARFVDGRPVRATTTCALVALLGVGWLIHRSRQSESAMTAEVRAPGDEW